MSKDQQNEKKPTMSLQNVTDVQHSRTAAIFLTSVAGMSVLCGFGMTLAIAKRRDPGLFGKGLIASRELPESGGSLAVKALGYATLYSLSGFSLFCFAVWKLMGVNNLQEFREKMTSLMPKIPKKQPSGRSDFESFRDLMQYITDESGKKS